MRFPVLGRELVLELTNGAEPPPEVVAAFCCSFMLGSVIGQLRHCGVADADIRGAVDQILACPPEEPPAVPTRPNLRPVK